MERKIITAKPKIYFKVLAILSIVCSVCLLTIEENNKSQDGIIASIIIWAFGLLLLLLANYRIYFFDKDEEGFFIKGILKKQEAIKFSECIRCYEHLRTFYIVTNKKIYSIPDIYTNYKQFVALSRKGINEEKWQNWEEIGVYEQDIIGRGKTKTEIIIKIDYIIPTYFMLIFNIWCISFSIIAFLFGVELVGEIAIIIGIGVIVVEMTGSILCLVAMYWKQYSVDINCDYFVVNYLNGKKKTVKFSDCNYEISKKLLTIIAGKDKYLIPKYFYNFRAFSAIIKTNVKNNC